MEWLSLVVIALLAGLAMPAGALIASVPSIGPRWLVQEWRHFVLALGAGALVSAVALVLVPEAIGHLSVASAVFWFLAGAFAFMLLDIVLARRQSTGSQLAAMLSDFIPESLALGAAAATGGNSLLIGILIGVQNLPEGFNAYRELLQGNRLEKPRIIKALSAMALLGPLFSLIGFWVLVHYPVVIASIMMFAGGGILYSVFQDLAPQIPLKKHWAPPMGAILGFLVGVVGLMLTGG